MKNRSEKGKSGWYRRCRKRLITILAIAIVFVTTYTLILPAITLDYQAAEEEPGVVLDESAGSEGADTETIQSEAVAPVMEDSIESTIEGSIEDITDWKKSDETKAAGTEAENISTIVGEIDDPAIETGRADDPASVNMPAQTFEKKTDDVKVYAEAEEGSLPEGTTMTLTPVDDRKTLDAIAKAVDGEISRVQAVDIMFKDADGNEIEPKKPIRVTMSSDIVAEAEEPVVVHVDDKGRASVVEQLDEKAQAKLEIVTAEDEVVFEADAFSVYAIVGTEQITVPFVSSDGSTYEVTVDFDKEAGIPEGAQLRVSEVTEDSSKYDTYVEQAADAIDTRVIDLNYVKLLDIEIVDKNENKVILNAPVNVQIKLLDKEQAEESTQVVHFEGLNETPVVMDSSVEADTVSFSTDGFSIYAVVGTGDEGDYARMTVEFYNGETKIATMYVKNKDTADELQTILYDPGVGTTPAGGTFKGWIQEKAAYDEDDLESSLTIEDIRDWAVDYTITENETVKFYAMFYKTFTVSYKDENNVILGSETKTLVLATDEIGYTVNMAYTPASSTQNFEGWHAADGATANIVDHVAGKLYKNGDEITITGDVTFTVEAPRGYWLVFDENGRGGTYNAPQFVRTGDETQRPRPDSEMQRYGYIFGGWYTDANCTDGNEFAFGQQLTGTTTIYAKWISNTTANYTVLIWKENLAGNGYDFAESVTLSGNVGSTINTVSQQGVGNNAYARITGRPGGQNVQYTGFHLDEFDQNVTIVTEGTSVLNVYYDRNVVTLNFYTFNATGYTRNYDNSAQTGVTYLGRFDNNGWANNNGNNYRQIYYYDGSWIYQNGNNYYYYNGDRYIRSGNWSLYRTTSGRFETLLSENNFTWPKTYNWYETQYAGGSAGGTRITFLDAYLPPNPNTTTYNVYGQDVEGDVAINFYKQDPDNPNNYVLTNTVYGTAGLGFYITDKYHGFEAYEYSVDGGPRTSVGTKDANGYYNNAETVTYNTGLNIYFNRLKYPVLYMDGVYVDGNGNPVEGFSSRGQLSHVDNIVYGSDISSYNTGGSNYYEPTYEGFVFEGWYIDDACTQPYTFTTMPEGITVYAKWRQIQYRVFLHPNAGTDTSLDWGDANSTQKQQMNFRVNYGGTVSLPTGLREEYEMVGWYLDEACTQAYPEGYVLNDGTVTANYDKTSDFTDVMDQWGNGATTNSDITGFNGGDRFWITRKLDIYAKWRKVLEGAEGIGIIYNANGGSNAPSDNNLYPDSANAAAQAASTAPQGKVFSHWVVQQWNGSEYIDTEVTVLPGQTFEVLKDYARREEKEGHTEANPNYSYTVQLKAEYVDKEEEIPTYIHFYANAIDKNGDTIKGITIAPDGNEPKDVTTYNNISINQACDILSIESLLNGSTLYSGYTFLGWAKSREATEPWLKWNGTNYDIVEGQEQGILEGVTQIAADEREPYENLYAIWEPNTFTVTIKKEVDSDYNSDLSKKFTFTPDTILAKYTDGQLKDGKFTLSNGETQAFLKVPYGTVISVEETLENGFMTTATKTLTSTADGTAIPQEQQTSADVALNNGGTGNITVNGDMTITYTNKRITQKVKIFKTGDDTNGAGLADAEFTLTKGADVINDYTVPSGLKSQSGEVLGVVKDSNGISEFELPVGTYVLNETQAPQYYTKSDAITITVNAEGVTYNVGDDGDISAALNNGVYTINVTDVRQLVDVVVKKMLVNPYLVDTGNAGVTFNFTATWGTDGKATFTVNSASKDGYKIEQVPAGVQMVITETADTSYVYDVTAAGASSIDKDTVGNTYTFDIPADGDTVTFTNTVEKLNGINITKVDKNTPSKGLAGATFDLLRCENLDGTGTFIKIGDAYSNGITSGTNGAMISTTDNIPEGYYRLIETNTPDGYIISNAEIDFRIDKDDSGETKISLIEKPENASLSADGKTLTITNTPGQALPSTGGPGTLLYTLSGLMLIIFSALMYVFAMRRRERRLK